MFEDWSHHHEVCQSSYSTLDETTAAQLLAERSAKLPMIYSINIVSINVQSLLDPAQFCEMYNVMQTYKIDVVLAQKTFLTDEAFNYYESNYSMISIATNWQENSCEGVFIIINNRTTSWLSTPQALDNHILYRDDNGWILICRIFTRNRALTIANVYAPAEVTQQYEWLTTTTNSLANTPLSYPCDIVGGDWNQTLTRLDWQSRQSPSACTCRAQQELLEQLEKMKCVYIDGWQSHHPNVMAFTYYWHEGISRIDWLYVRSELMKECKDWKILSSGLPTDHWAVSLTIGMRTSGDWGPDRWWLNPLILKNTKIIHSCRDTLKMLPGQNPLTEWQLYKITVKKTLQGYTKDSQKSQSQLRYNLERRRQRLWEKRCSDTLDQALEMRIAAIELQEQCLAEWQHHSYVYNALAKHFLLNEKPTKWFFSRVKIDTYHNINALRDEQDVLHTSSEELLDVATTYYDNLYAKKSSDKGAQEQMLECLHFKISNLQAEGMVKPITTHEIRALIARTALGKSSDDDGLSCEFYKGLMRQLETDGELKILLRLQALYNHIQTHEEISENWTDGVLTLLYKSKGSEKDLKNYHSLSIMNVDYKIFTEILMQHLVKALDKVLELHQSAFLPGRLIDDNVWTIQYLIAKHWKVEGIDIVFLDQEKAYDWVSHRFMWATLKCLEVPPTFIGWIKKLYKDAKIRIYINGHLSREVKVQYDVQQSDPLSCPLFIAVIESLAQIILQDKCLQGVQVGPQYIKTTMYADDTTVMIKTQVEADTLMKILDSYSRASGSRINWEKSYLLTVGHLPNITILGIQSVSPSNPYFHLGVLIGIDTDTQAQDYWDKTVQKFQSISDQWLKFHLSLKRRVLIVNSLMMSVLRYAVQFIDLPTITQKQLEKEYYRLIWDDKMGGTVKDLQACSPRKIGGIGCIDLESILSAETISMIQRIKIHPELLWVHLAISLILMGAGTNLLIEAIKDLWFQQLSSIQTVPKELAHVWMRWKKLYNQKNQKSVIIHDKLQSPADVLETYLWYHPKIGIISGDESRCWGSHVWWLLWALGARVLGHVWDPVMGQLVVPPGLIPCEVDSVRTIIWIMMQIIPEEWLILLQGINEMGPWTSTSREEFFLRAEKPLPFNMANFTKAYKAILRNRLDSSDFSDWMQDPIYAYKERTGCLVISDWLWQAARSQFGILKTDDLLWRLLHKKVITGNQLEWISETQRCCPIHLCDFTIYHIWIECTVAETVWQEMKGIWAYLTETPAVISCTVNELITFMVISPDPRAIEGRRWLVLYQTAVWSLWKTYLSHSFALPHCYWSSEAVKSYYIELMKSWILTDRITSMKEIYKNKHYNEDTFTWL